MSGWSFQNAGPPAANSGPDLDEITTNLLGFSALAGETKVRLLPQPWPEQQLPPTTSSLLSVASKKGLVAAAGPDSLVIASTDAVRKAYHADVAAENNVKPFTPQTTIAVPRLSQVAFSSDESCLVITAESGGGFNVYDVDSLLQGNQESAFQLATNNTSIRALLPNPAPEFAHLYAVILVDGKLMVANLKDRQFGNVIKDGVSCVSWSAKGKQLVAGLQDGSAAQYDPQGNLKATIPKPAQLDHSLPMTTISWVSNDEFLTIHTPISGDETDSVYHMLYRDKASGTFTSRKLSGDPCPAFGMSRTPASHFVARLRQFPPNLEEMLILSSTAAVDVGVISKASISLADDDMSSENAVNVFTTTGMSEDTRRAQMPMSATGDTSPIGMALDLSSTTNVIKPIPSEEMDESATPAPALMVLNNEGVLCTWWIIYNDSIRQRTAYPGLVSASSSAPQAAQPTAQPSAFGAAASTPSAFGSSVSAQPAFGATSTFGKPAQPAFGSVGFAKPAAPAFGSPSAPSGFGGASALGSQSPWAAASTGNAGSAASPAFGKPAFGSSTALGASAGGFGAASGLGAKTSPWGKPAEAQTSPSGTFGQASPAFGGAAASSGASAFASLGAKSDKPAFASSEQKPTLASPFSSFGNNQTSSSGDNKPSGFGQPSFGSTITLPSTTGGSFGAASTIGAKPSPWGSPAPAASSDSPSTKEETMTDDNAEKTVESSQETAKTDSASTGIFGQPAKPAQQSPFASLNISSKPSVFGQPSEKAGETPSKSPFAQKSPSIFGQPSGKPTQSPFAQLSADKTKTSPFAPSPNQPNASPFASTPAKSSTSSFGQPSDKSVQSAFGQPSAAAANFSGFKLGSTFQPNYSDDSAEDEDDDEEATTSKDAGKSKDAAKSRDSEKSKDAGKSLFGSSFTNMLGEAAKDSPNEPETPIKKEPGIDEPKLQDISTTPATVNKPVQEAPAEPEDAPLPPDFTTFKPKPVEEDLPPIAGSPPIDLGASSQLSSPVSSIGDDENEGEEEDEEEDDEDDEEDVDGPADDDDESWQGAEDDEEDEGEVGSEQDDTVSRPPKTDAASAFGSRLSFPAQPMTVKKPTPLPSTTPAGFPKAPIFPAPQKRSSPRSPSPIRPLDRSVGSAPARSSSRQSSSRQPLTVPAMPSKPASKSSSTAQKPPPPPAEPEAGELSDAEDLRIQDILHEPVEPRKDLEPFVAHQDYLGSTTKPGIGGQIEKVYRDINSMIDTLGLNVRSLQAFVKGHEELGGTERERSDLEDPEDWCLVEIDNLNVVEKNLGDSLDSGKVDDVKGKVDELNELYKSSVGLRTRTAEMRKQIVSRTDPEQRNAQRAAALATEAQMQQTELRQGVSKVQKLLHEAEEALSILRADLATNSTASQPSQRVPTVEAVTNTIMKMTAMIERKSGDVDVLEAQIRRLPQGLAGLSLDDDATDLMRSSVRSINSSHHGSQHPFLATPPTRRTIARSTTQPQLGMSGMFGSSITGRFQTPMQAARKSQSTYGFAYTPEESGADLRGSVNLGSSVRSLNSSMRKKKMSDVSQEEVGRYLAKREQRRRVHDALKATVEKRGTRVVGTD